MSLKDKISSDIKEKMKAKDSLALDCLRLIMSVIKNREIEKRSELTDAECFAVLSTIAKQRVESIDMYKKGGRQDLVDKESAELKIIQSYLPAQLSESELAKLIDETVANVGAKVPADMGKVMKALTPKVQGRADGKRVSELVKEKLKS